MSDPQTGSLYNEQLAKEANSRRSFYFAEPDWSVLDGPGIFKDSGVFPSAAGITELNHLVYHLVQHLH